MINRDTGQITFDEPALTIGPETTRTAFLASEIARQSRSATANEPWHSWHLPPMRAGDVLGVTVFFHGDALKMVVIEDTNPRFGRSWADYSDENERQRKAVHDKWLAERCHVAPGEFKWGTLHSNFGPEDPWAGTSNITLRYGQPPVG